jgi:hypothetical protein
LPMALHVECAGDGFIIGLLAAEDFHQLHLVDGLKKRDPDVSRLASARANPGDRQTSRCCWRKSQWPACLGPARQPALRSRFSTALTIAAARDPAVACRRIRAVVRSKAPSCGPARTRSAL